MSSKRSDSHLVANSHRRGARLHRKPQNGSCLTRARPLSHSLPKPLNPAYDRFVELIALEKSQIQTFKCSLSHAGPPFKMNIIVALVVAASLFMLLREIYRRVFMDFGGEFDFKYRYIL